MWLGSKKYWLFQALGWGLFISLHIFFNLTLGKIETADERDLFLRKFGLFVTLGIVFTHLMRLCIIQLNLLQKKIETQVLQFTLLAIVVSFFASLADIYIRRDLMGLQYLTKGEGVMLGKLNIVVVAMQNIVGFLVYYFIWCAIYFMYHYISKSRKQQLDALKMETLIKELELKTIKAHINPPFIFNSLNSIRALVDENPQRARKAVTELSNILRSSMKADKMETVPLEKELSIVKDYLELEHMRFEDRLKVEYEIDPDTLNQPVPPMMLQTLVENAIKHGISKQISGGVVKITSDFVGGYHTLIVQNTGQLKSSYNADGFGLSSTNNRLSLLYGDDAQFKIRQINGSLVEAKVLIPVKTV